MQAGDARDAPSSVRGAARLIETGDRRAEVGIAGRRAHVEHLVGREFTVEDVPADEPVLVLHLGGPDDLPVQDRIRESGRDRVDACDDSICVRVELGLVRRRRVGVRNPLREHRHDVLACGRERGIEHAGDADVGEGQGRGPARDRVLERAFDVVERLREHDRSAVHLGVEAGFGRELGKPVHGDVHLDGAAARAPMLDALDELRRQQGRVDVVAERDLRMRRRDDDIGSELLA